MTYGDMSLDIKERNRLVLRWSDSDQAWLVYQERDGNPVAARKLLESLKTMAGAGVFL